MISVKFSMRIMFVFVSMICIAIAFLKLYYVNTNGVAKSINNLKGTIIIFDEDDHTQNQRYNEQDCLAANVVHVYIRNDEEYEVLKRKRSDLEKIIGLSNIKKVVWSIGSR